MSSTLEFLGLSCSASATVAFEKATVCKKKKKTQILNSYVQNEIVKAKENSSSRGKWNL